MIKELDYYSILKIDFGAPKADVTSAYRRLVKIHHPDINHDPGAEDLMKEINLAYSVLSDDTQREAYNRTYSSLRRNRSTGTASDARVKEQREKADSLAHAAIDGYFSCILNNDFEKAYTYLSDFDKQYVTRKSFCEWRKSVRRLFIIREYSVRSTEDVSSTLTTGSGASPTKKHNINIIEKNLLTNATDSYRVVKQTVLEHGQWHVLLGYRDLNEIAKLFEQLSVEQEKNEMEKHWEQYCAFTCRELDMLSLSGLQKEAQREIYRYSRYKQPMTVACYKIKPSEKSEWMTDILETAAHTVNTMIRETDIAAYIGDNTFAVLFVELKKRNAQAIVNRLADKLRTDSKGNIRENITVDCAFLTYKGEPIETYIEKNIEMIVKKV